MPKHADRATRPSAGAVSAVRAIYAELEARPIVRACETRTDCCRFRLTGRTPYLTKGEALLAALALRASGRRDVTARASGDCPLLDEAGRCSIYDARPFGCRTHFCAAAGGPYARSQVRDLLHRLEDLDAALGGEGAKTLPTAIAEALQGVR